MSTEDEKQRQVVTTEQQLAALRDEAQKEMLAMMDAIEASPVEMTVTLGSGTNRTMLFRLPEMVAVTVPTSVFRDVVRRDSRLSESEQTDLKYRLYLLATQNGFFAYAAATNVRTHGEGNVDDYRWQEPDSRLQEMDHGAQVLAANEEARQRYGDPRVAMHQSAPPAALNPSRTPPTMRIDENGELRLSPDCYFNGLVEIQNPDWISRVAGFNKEAADKVYEAKVDKHRKQVEQAQSNIRNAATIRSLFSSPNTANPTT